MGLSHPGGRKGTTREGFLSPGGVRGGGSASRPPCFTHHTHLLGREGVVVAVVAATTTAHNEFNFFPHSQLAHISHAMDSAREGKTPPLAGIWKKYLLSHSSPPSLSFSPPSKMSKILTLT